MLIRMKFIMHIPLYVQVCADVYFFVLIGTGVNLPNTYVLPSTCFAGMAPGTHRHLITKAFNLLLSTKGY
jgi:DNA-binding transcriptional regulator YhcF (GntR family)